VIKLGSAGSCGFTEGDRVGAEPYPITRTVDTIGAGDAFAAGLLSVLLDDPEFAKRPAGAPSRETLQAALERGNLMGALATQFRGDWEGLPTLAELQRIRTGQRHITR
jgi:2-dehydro-3-deoxygluconokinase